MDVSSALAAVVATLALFGIIAIFAAKGEREVERQDRARRSAWYAIAGRAMRAEDV